MGHTYTPVKACAADSPQCVTVTHRGDMIRLGGTEIAGVIDIDPVDYDVFIRALQSGGLVGGGITLDRVKYTLTDGREVLHYTATEVEDFFGGVKTGRFDLSSLPQPSLV